MAGDQEMPEAELKAAVLKIAKRERWLVHHTANRQGSRNSAKGSGVPDLIMAHPEGRLILAELKKQKGKLEPLQEQWQFALERCPGIEYYVWRPSDLPDVERILGGTRRRRVGLWRSDRRPRKCKDDRVIDLTIGAFQKLAPWGAGEIRVTLAAAGLPATDTEGFTFGGS